MNNKAAPWLFKIFVFLLLVWPENRGAELSCPCELIMFDQLPKEIYNSIITEAVTPIFPVFEGWRDFGVDLLIKDHRWNPFENFNALLRVNKKSRELLNQENFFVPLMNDFKAQLVLIEKEGLFLECIKEKLKSGEAILNYYGVLRPNLFTLVNGYMLTGYKKYDREYAGKCCKITVYGQNKEDKPNYCGSSAVIKLLGIKMQLDLKHSTR